MPRACCSKGVDLAVCAALAAFFLPLLMTLSILRCAWFSNDSVLIGLVLIESGLIGLWMAYPLVAIWVSNKGVDASALDDVHHDALVLLRSW